MQGNVSILGLETCRGGDARLLKGDFTLDEALRRLLAGAPCNYRIVDDRTVAITAARPAPTPTPSPPSPPPRPVELTEIVVHATKRDASLDTLSAAASVIPRRGLSAMGAADVGETTGQLAGVSITNLGPGRDKLMVRGLSDGAFTGRARSTVGTFLDDMPINYSAPDPDLRLVDVEQVEVVRGPQGSLYGSGSLSGVYRIVTAKPDLARASGEISVMGASTVGGSPSREIEGWLNLPVASNRLGVRAVAYYEELGGYLDDVNMRQSDVDRTLRSGGRIAVRAQLSDSFQADLAMTGQRLSTNDTQYTTPIAGRRRRANRVRESHNNDFFQVAATIEGDLGWAALRSSTGFVRHTYASQYDASAALDLFSANGFDLGVYSEGARVDLLVQDVAITSHDGGDFTWLLGVYGARSREMTPSELGVRRGQEPIATIYQEARRDLLSELALYGEATYRWGGGWSLSAGARAFRTRIETTSQVTLRPPGQSRGLALDSDSSGVSPKISIQRELASGGLIYALMSEGYRAGGVNSGGLAPLPAALRYFAPDHLRNFEIGAKARLLDRRLSLRGALFHDIWADIQTDRYLPSGLAYTTNVGDAEITGLEAEASYDWNFGLSLQANATFSDSRITRASAEFGAPLIRRLPGVPQVSGGFVAIYQRPLWGGVDLQATAEASYVGPSRLSFESSLSPPMGDFVRNRAGLDLVAEHWRFGIFMTNLADDAGNTFAYGNPFTFGQVRQVTPQRPRTIGARLTTSF